MRWKLALTFIIILYVSKVVAQFDSMILRTTYYYSGYQYNVRQNKNKININKEDTISKQKIGVFKIRLDTLINLSGNNRKLIVFSNCVDSFLLNTKKIIVKGRIEDLPKDKYGALNYSLYNKTKESAKATVLFQSNREIYTLTVPSNFLSLLRNSVLVSKLDLAILSLNQDSSSMSHQILEEYLFFEGLSLPIIPFLELNKSITKPDSDFENQFYIYDSTIKDSKNGFLKQSDWYIHNSKWSNYEIGISPKYGIIAAYHETEEKGENKTSGVVIYLTKTELSK